MNTEQVEGKFSPKNNKTSVAHLNNTDTWHFIFQLKQKDFSRGMRYPKIKHEEIQPFYLKLCNLQIIHYVFLENERKPYIKLCSDLGKIACKWIFFFCFFSVENFNWVNINRALVVDDLCRVWNLFFRWFRGKFGKVFVRRSVDDESRVIEIWIIWILWFRFLS